MAEIDRTSRWNFKNAISTQGVRFPYRSIHTKVQRKTNKDGMKQLKYSTTLQTEQKFNADRFSLSGNSGWVPKVIIGTWPYHKARK